MYKSTRRATSTIAGAGEGVFAKKFIPNGTIIGQYNGYKKPLKDVDEKEMIYAADVGRNNVVIGTGLAAKINDNIVMRKLNHQETHDAKNKGVFPTHPGKDINTQFIRTKLPGDTKYKIYVQATRDIQKGEELFLSYGNQQGGYWDAMFTNHDLYAY